MSVHPFDSYAAFTNLKALKEASAKPLRKCLRVNTLKSSVEEFKQWAKQAGWEIEPVPWCKEGFFIDRENREHALGKDLMHLLGHVYMQEASSMLPVELLDPQPGEAILDMAAAPGSKTTQIAAKMGSRGVVVANDMQEKRLGTLKSALHRAGVINYVITKKMGQWFGNEMTERFDRVLCDAPCTAQGTVRKDADALKYSSKDSVGKMAKLQRQLLESAVHAAKVGGRIVYSTCTLTPEENEIVVRDILNKYCDQLTVVDPGKLPFKNWKSKKAVKDSVTVQKSLEGKSKFPFLRIWPQTYNTEGFFCAVLEKTATTKYAKHNKPEYFQERPLRGKEQEDIGEHIEEIYGTSFMDAESQLFEREDQIILSTKDVRNFSLPVTNYSLGLPYAKRVGGSRFRITHDLAIRLGQMASCNVLNLGEEQMKELLNGKDTECSVDISGDTILLWNGLGLGLGLAKDGVLKNRLDRWLVQQSGE